VKKQVTAAGSRGQANRDTYNEAFLKISAFIARVPKDIAGLISIAVAIFLLISYFSRLSGFLGRFLDDLFSYALGAAKILIPVYLAGLGIILIMSKKESGAFKGINSGFIFITISVCGLLNAASGVKIAAKSLKIKKEGGYLGGLLYSALNYATGRIGTFIILITVLLIGLLYIYGKSILQLIESFIRAVKRHERPNRSVQARGEIKAPQINDSSNIDLLEDDQNHSQNAKEPGAEISSRHRDEDPEMSDSEIKIKVNEEPNPHNQEVVGSDEKTSFSQPALDLGLGHPIHWRKPPFNLLVKGKQLPQDKESIMASGETLVKALSTLGVETTLAGITIGPSVTRYELELASGVKVSKVTSLNKDIAYALAAPDVRILAPIPGVSAVGVEVPNKVRQLVTLGDLINTAEMKNKRHPLCFALGRSISGSTVVANLAEMPHVLIAGATGAGKSSCINSMLMTFIMRASPDELRLVLIDPKRVELGQYSGLPHLLMDVVTNPKKAANALLWTVKEMEKRYDLLAAAGARDIDTYNQRVKSSIALNNKTLPYLVVVVDELNDLMMVAPRDVEDSICRIAQMARAVGIHLVVATQRPSVDVITGVIKANIPSRLAFSVSSLADSRVILDQGGAERLGGKGDMLYLSATSSVIQRIQAPWVSQKEISDAVEFWKAQGRPEETTESPPEIIQSYGDSEEEELYEKAKELVIKTQLGSASMLQRRLKIGFPKAGRLIDLMEERGVVGPASGSKPRSVLIQPEDTEL
jgi:S-DNA-T family DNA segregation ATPase FtsK/SpoIIIE